MNLIEATNYFLEADEFSLPNENSLGKPIAQTEEALRNFWNWFGDSKVVDKQGRPLVVYHGTDREFDMFDKSKSTKQFNNHQHLLGHFFTSNEEYAQQYGSLIMACYLKVTTPKVFPLKQIDKIENMSWSSDVERFTRKIKRNGHDGILFSDGGMIDEWVVFGETAIRRITK